MIDGMINYFLHFRERISRLTFLMLAAVFLFAPYSRAEVPDGYLSPRPAGMGGAFTAVANDESVFWTNPAGISRVRKARSREVVHIVKIPNVTIAANTNSKNVLSVIKGSTSDGVADAIAGSSLSPAKPFYARAAAFPVILFDAGKNNPMGFGVFENSAMRVFIDKNIPTDARIVAVTDVGANYGVAYSNPSNRFNLGMTLRPTYRYAYEDTSPTSELKSKTALVKRINKGSNRGVGVGADVGFLFTLADFWYPTIGGAIRNLPTGCKANYLNPFTELRQNICGTKFSGSSGNPDALSVLDPMDTRIGVSISPRLAKDFGMRFTGDIQNISLGSGKTYYGMPGIDAAKMLHGGIEFYSGNPLARSAFAVQVGANQGFVTWGVTANTPFASLEIASYGADISSTVKRIEDRRYVASISFAM